MLLSLGTVAAESGGLGEVYSNLFLVNFGNVNIGHETALQKDFCFRFTVFECSLTLPSQHLEKYFLFLVPRQILANLL